MLNCSEVVIDVDYVLRYGDPRLESYPFMKSVVPTLALSMAYVIFVKVIGPKWMQNKKPYNLQQIMIAYNLAMVALSAWIFFRISYYGWFFHYKWLCQPIDYSQNENALRILSACYIYLLSKFIEYLDTIFMVLRKKDSQITFLHVFHHSVMTIFTWYATKYCSGGYPTILPLANSFVHTVMYAYYGLSAFGPTFQKYLWWKRYLTELQFVQFTIIILHMIQVMTLPVEYCKVTYFQALLTIAPAIIFFALFIPFYRQKYTKKVEKKKL